jgi:hypothetical protein
MTKETREERIVRSMVPQLTECLIELKNLSVGHSKESDVEVWCQTVLKSVLGFSAGSGYQVRSQETRGKMRFDLVVARADSPDRIILAVEVKKLGANLDKSDLRSGKTQLKEYIGALGDVRWGLLTNGYEWRLYDFKSDSIAIASVDVRDEQHEINTTTKGAEETAWDLIDLCSYYHESKTWEKLSQEAQAFSPDSLAKAILTNDSVKRIAKYLTGEHEYRVSVDVLTDKLAELVEQGLSGLVGNWNDTNRDELAHYVRTQKKAAKKVRRKAKETPAETVVTTESSAETTTTAGAPTSGSDTNQAA